MRRSGAFRREAELAIVTYEGTQGEGMSLSRLKLERRGSMQGFCMKCRQTREMKNPTQVTMKNKRKATKGTCGVCGTKMFKIG